MVPMRALLAVAMMLAISFAGCSAQTDDEIVMGLLMPLTGPAATLGSPAALGARLAVEEINAAGGIDGSPIRLAEGDTKFPDTQEAVAAFDRVAGEGAKFIVGALASDSSLAIKPRAAEEQVVLMSPASTRPSLTGPEHGYFFRTIANDDVQGPQAAGYLHDTLGQTTTVLMYQSTSYAEGLLNVFQPAYEGMGGIVLGDPIQWTDDEAQMAAKAQEATTLGVGAIWIAGQAPEIGTLIREIRNQGFEGVIMASEAIEGDGIFDVAPEAVDGVYFTKSAPSLDSPAYQGFLAAYEAKYGTSPGPFDAYAYDAVYVGAAAIEAVGNDGAAIRGWLLENSVPGRVTTDSISFLDGDVTTGGYQLYVVDAQNRAFVPYE